MQNYQKPQNNNGLHIVSNYFDRKFPLSQATHAIHSHLHCCKLSSLQWYKHECLWIKIAEAIWIWNPINKDTSPKVWLIWLTELSCCLHIADNKKALGRAESRGMKVVRGWSLFKMSWLLKKTLCNCILISRTSYTGKEIRFSCIVSFFKLRINTILDPQLNAVLYKELIGMAVPVIVTRDLICSAEQFGLEDSLLYCT